MTSRSKLPRYVKIGELVEMLDVSHSTIYRWISDGYIPAPVVFGDAKKNSTVRWSLDEILAWIETRPRGKAE